MPYPLNNRTSKTLDYFIPSIVFNRIKLKKKYLLIDQIDKYQGMMQLD